MAECDIIFCMVGKVTIYSFIAIVSLCMIIGWVCLIVDFANWIQGKSHADR